MPLQFSWVSSMWDAVQGFHPLALLQWWGTGKSAGQVLAVHQLCPSGRSASLITGHTQLHKRWRRTSCSTPDSFCTTATEYWSKTVGTTIFSSPLVAVYSFILPGFCFSAGLVLAFCLFVWFGFLFGFFCGYMPQGLAMFSATIIDWLEQTKPANLA